jgi:hypothetical protein
MKNPLKKVLRYMADKTRLTKQNNKIVPEVELNGPLLLPKVIIARYFMDRIKPGEQIIFRSNGLDMPWEMEHMCNRLGHDLMEVGREGETYFFTLRIRGEEDRLPLQDPYHLTLTPHSLIDTIDISPTIRLGGTSGMLPGGLPLLQVKKE